jgi:2-(1,2-epoxy-1,2-dihydrophenyl)acetyl-CoA isomerase
MARDDARRFHDRVRLATVDDDVAWLVMERGERPANAFDASMVDAMTEALSALPDTAGCLVLRGDREFSVGADLAAVREAPADRRSERIEAIAGASNRFIRGLRGLDQPVVAAVNGTAAGGGLGFALSCDLVVMHTDAVLDPAYARIGLTPDNATPFFLARALGPYRARALLFDPRPIDAEDARSLGLSSRTVSGDRAAFDDAVGELAADLARTPTSVQGMTKSLVDTAFTDPLDTHLKRERAAIKRAADSPAFQEGLAAFFEDRPPDWP